MSFDTARRDIEKRLQDNWATTRIAFDNVKFDQPKTTESFIRLKIFEDTVNRINIGMPGVHRHAGTIIIDIVTPKDVGTKTARDYGATLAALFRDAQFNGITCREARFKLVGDMDGWFVASVSVPFYYDGVYG